MTASEENLVRIEGPLRPGDVPRLCEQVAAARHGPQGGPGGGGPGGGGAGDVVCDVGAVTTADFATVDAIARLHLAARRAGGRIRLRNPAPALLALLGLVGLVELLGLVVEMEGHAEQREPPGRVQEAVEAGDPAL
ncbi:STAS domain-containing protein [Streptomyces sp. Je 1-369]|uniref:STAS domain-containing protein n=1 Tax=Streptomyces sp. Je 1-369 TaxID=2966192 RepID=UPI00228658A3|nr:STAS domain-containing protein [Streptomyces sp. Je 1-369]WAL97492.1 STAS domain-containing protein [Streptomyces sp. Je 1-369]